MRAKIQLPDEFVRNILRVCGKAGSVWLDDLPVTVKRLEREWRIVVGRPFEGLSYNFVAAAADEAGRPVVVKVGLPIDDGEIHGEAAYLRVKDGNGAVRLLRRTKNCVLCCSNVQLRVKT